ncbi:polyprenyl synthetase family protein [Streptosporangium algeriense]|uniref:Polyprenyl synthetase family protein n=1 Tax=Streptosporangium algeriense TaxID=1682748 RepID=A0ABW3DIX0_9ACTN
MSRNGDFPDGNHYDPSGILIEFPRRVTASIDPRMREIVADLPEPVRSMARYHLRWADDQGAPLSGGERILRRYGSLMMLCVSRERSAWDRAVNVAAAGNLMMASQFIHDDIIDNDQERYGKPTVWARFGVPAAIMLGDALTASAYAALADEPPQVARELIRLMSATIQHISAAQTQEMANKGRTDITLQESMAVVEAKAGRPAQFACAAGVAGSGGTPSQVAAAAELGLHLGTAVQLHDDLNELWPTKDPASETDLRDLRERKTIPAVAYALQISGRHQEELSRYLQKTVSPGTTELLRVRALLDKIGAHEWLGEQLTGCVDAALTHIPEVTPVPLDQQEIRQYITDWLTPQ